MGRHVDEWRLFDSLRGNILLVASNSLPAGSYTVRGAPEVKGGSHGPTEMAYATLRY